MLQVAADLPEELREFHRNHERTGGACAKRLQAVYDLEGHGLGVHALGRGKHGLQRLGVAFRFQYRALLFTLGAQDRRLFFTLRHRDARLTFAVRFGDIGAPRALRRHLSIHRILHIARRFDLPNLDGSHFDA